jgi:hypothetical protein
MNADNINKRNQFIRARYWNWIAMEIGSVAALIIQGKMSAV